MRALALLASGPARPGPNAFSRRAHSLISHPIERHLGGVHAAGMKREAAGILSEFFTRGVG
jgi:hypothetical protein